MKLHFENPSGQWKDMAVFAPTSAEEMADALAESASKQDRIRLIGKNSKSLMAGPIAEAETTVSTASLRRVLQYEPNDLTVSAEAGMPWSELQRVLGERGQMIALDPPFWADATVGGVVASNSSGPWRALYGTARDLVIGMTFATLEGRLIKTGGMVVKNVAGLDMAKPMIGSFGTLAAITSINFRVHSRPEGTRSFLFSFPDVEKALEKRDTILKSVLRPLAIDLLSPVASTRLGQRGYLLAIRAAGSTAVLNRYGNELTAEQQLTGDAEREFWRQVREFGPDFMRRQPNGLALRISTTLTDMAALLRLVSGPSVSRAASGLTYLYLSSWQAVPSLWKAAAEHGWPVVVELAPHDIRTSKELWLEPKSISGSNAFDMMKKIKKMFDPSNLLNTARLYGRI